jgi:hypothetical protein
MPPRIGIAFLTKDKPELSEQTVGPLINPDRADLWFIDGSATPEGKSWPHGVMLAFPSDGLRGGSRMFLHSGIRGGPDAAIVYALTQMLKCQYEYIALVEQDVLLDKDWLEPTMELFIKGQQDGLQVGAVSARAYEDRILIQRDGYAVMHNLGAGMVVFTKQAAQLIVSNYRTGWWPNNRRLFVQLTGGLDIGVWGAFKANEQAITADWHFDVILASRGLASLALTPCKAKMIGQPMALEEMGLRLVTEPLELMRNEESFQRFRDSTTLIRAGKARTSPVAASFLHDSNAGHFT